MINVMSKGDDKAMACGNGRYLDESHAVADDEFTQERNVKFQCGYARKFWRLPLHQEVSNFFKHIKADANHHLIARSYRDSRSRLCSFVNKNFVARAVKQKQASINRHSLTTKRNEVVS